MLTKTEREEHQKHILKLQAASTKMLEQVEKYNSLIDSASKLLLEAQEEYEEVLSETRGWVEDIVSSHDEKIQSRSESWRDSDKGQEAMEWLDRWSEGHSELSDPLIEESYVMPEQLDPNQLMHHIETLNDLPDVSV